MSPGGRRGMRLQEGGNMSSQVIRDAIEKVGKAIADDPQKARVKNAPATATLKTGLGFAVTGPNGEAVETDMPKGVGGGAAAPNPGWLLRAALASCTGTVIAMRAAQLGIEVTALDVTVESTSDNRGMLGLDERVSAALSGICTRIAIRADKATPDQLEEISRWGDTHSPVACTLRQALGSEIDVVIM
jgi:uncharacterized OsmC-like protein